MKVLKGILKDSYSHYKRLERNLSQRGRKLPNGSVKQRRINGRIYYYLQKRKGDKVVHLYLGRKKPEKLLKSIQEFRKIKKELKKVRAALRLLPRRKLRP